jgi:hypothetical protein
MVRGYYYVREIDGVWQISLHEPAEWVAPVRYDSKSEAVEGASKLARAEWTATTKPTGVRVRHGAGDWSTDATFGSEPPALFTPPA